MTCFIFFIPAVFAGYRNQAVGIIRKIIYLCGFKPYFIYPAICSQQFNSFQLVFIGFYNKELKEYIGRFTIELFFPVNDIFCPFYNLGQFTANALLLVYFLGSAVYGNDQPVKAAFNSSACIFASEIMRIGRSCCVNSFRGGIQDHLQEIRIQIRLSLEIKYKIK